MTVGELRIGNYIKYKGTIIPVIAVYIGQPTLKDAEPIQLTPEILKNAGFLVKNSIAYDVFDCSINGHEFYFYKEEKYLILKTRSKLNSKNRFLHQLQNLYFALTSEELQINPQTKATTATL